VLLQQGLRLKHRRVLKPKLKPEPRLERKLKLKRQHKLGLAPKRRPKLRRRLQQRPVPGPRQQRVRPRKPKSVRV
jgi:hypothetical protein